MAKVKLPLLSAQVSNKVGDIVYYHRGDFGINVARILTKPKNPRTPNQQAIRTNIANLMQLWLDRTFAAGLPLYIREGDTFKPIAIATGETFTDEDREAWKNYVHVTRQGYKVTGRLAFIGVNMQLLNEGRGVLKRPGVFFNIKDL
ncbi:hypothetical protein [Caldisericum sp.]|uniref:hypothetical protein n=1 Tax=Caldisericum sp. TaxID=2499687 RepID=UPI003D0BCC32